MTEEGTGIPTFSVEEQIADFKLVECCPRCGIKITGLTICPNDGLPVVPDLVPGTMLADRYEIVDVIGRGGMSIIYKAIQPSLGRTVAVKMMHTHMVTDPQHLQRFAREAQTISQLSHPNIVSVHDFGITPGGQPFFILDYVKHGSLANYIEKNGPLKPDLVTKWLRDVCDGFAHAHSKGFLHRDIKPSNLMVDEDASGELVLKIVDFGIAKITGSDDKAHQKLTKTGDVIGSPLYMSPEQCRGSQLNERSDIYSIGCVIYEALSGKPPHSGSNPLETIYRQTTEKPNPLPMVSAALESVVFKCLEKDPQQRYASMSEVATALGEAHASGGRMSQRAMMRMMWIPYVASLLLTGAIIAFLLAKAAPTHQGVHVQYPAPPPYLVSEAPKVLHDNREANLYIYYGQKDPRVSIEGSQVTDDGIKDIKHAASMTYFDGSKSKLTDVGAGYLSEAKQLKTVIIDQSNLTAKGLTALSSLPNLQVLTVGATFLSPESVTALTKFKHLKQLSLPHVMMPADTLSSLKKLPKLEALGLYLNSLSPAQLADLPPVPMLDLSGNALDAAAIDVLNKQPVRTGLVLSNCSLTDDLVARFTNLNPKYLSLNDNDVTDRTLQLLATKSNLRRLCISDTKITDAGLAYLANVRGLYELRLDRADITDAGVRALSPLSDLTQLSLSRTRITDESVDTIIKSFPNLQRLNLEDTPVSATAVQRLSKLPRLKELYLWNPHGIINIHLPNVRIHNTTETNDSDPDDEQARFDVPID